MGTTALQAWLLPQISIDEVAAEADLTRYGSPAAASAHQEIWQPARVLDECRAKREVLGLVREFGGLESDDMCCLAIRGFVDTLVQAMAVPYSDRPGYRAATHP